jgi:hypothetical protein
MTLSESATATDTGGISVRHNLSVSEAVVGADSVSLPTYGTAEAATAADTVSMSASFTMTIAEAADATDTASIRAAFLASMAEALTASDAFVGVAPSVYTLTLSEAVTALDLVETTRIKTSLKGFVTATITIGPASTGAVDILPGVTGTTTKVS